MGQTVNALVIILNNILNLNLLFIDRESPCESPAVIRERKTGAMLRSNSTSSFNGAAGGCNAMFSSPSMPNIALASKNSALLVKKPLYEDMGNASLHSQRNPLLVQAIIANQLERINQTRMNRTNSVPSMGPVVSHPKQNGNSESMNHSQQLTQLNSLALFRLHQMTEEVNQIRTQSQNLAMTQNLSQLTLENSAFHPNSAIPKVIRASRVHSWNIPFENRTAAVHDDLAKNDEMRRLTESLAKIADVSQLDTIVTRQASRDELRLVHSEKHVAGYLGISPLARANDETQTPDELAAASSRRATAAVSDLAAAVMTRQIGNGFALYRPGGAQAEKDRADNGAFFNAVAVATKMLHEHYPQIRTLIIGWDEHHSNGTQNIFYSDPNVLHISIHKSSTSLTGKIDEVDNQYT